MFEAAKSGDLNVIRSLNDVKILETVTPQMSTVLHIAARYNQEEIAEQVISKYPLLLVQANAYGDAPLHVATRIGSSEMVQILVTGAKEVGVGDVESGESCIGVKRMLSM